MTSDLYIAIRSLRRSPAFTLAAIFTLALGIGANATMFSVVNAVLLRPIPGYQTDRLVRIAETGRPGHDYLDPEMYPRLREKLRSFSVLAANQYCRMNLIGHGEPEQLNGPCTTANWFEMQGAQAMLGRTFLPDEDHHGRNHVVVLDFGFWQSKFAGDPAIVGQKLLFDHEPWLVIGVMPRGFRPVTGDAPSIYTAYVVADNPHGLNVIGRLQPGVTLAAAQAELNIVVAQLARENPDWKSVKLSATPLLEQRTGAQRPLLLLLWGAVSFVLLIACVNVANLFLARSTARQREIDVRLALGATRWHIVRFVLSEAIVVAAIASLAALGVAYGGLRLLQPLTATLPRAAEIDLDSRVFIGTLLLGGLSTVLFGMLPAVRSARTLSSAGMAVRATAKSQGLLIAAEVALAFVLLTGAGLLIRTFVAMRSTNLGYDPQHVLQTFLALRPASDGTRTAGVAQYARIREKIAALPGVRGVATASSIPGFGVSISMPVHPEGRPERAGQQSAYLDVVSDDYFAVMGIPVRAGRGFTHGDRAGSTPVVMVSESVSNRYFAGKPIGKRIVVPEFLFNIDGGPELAAEIVGVAGNVCVNSVSDCEAEHVYLPESQNALRMENLLVRTSGDPGATVNAVRHTLYRTAPEVPPETPHTLEEATAYLTDSSKRAMWLLAVFAGLALSLAAVGIYGVSAYLAAQRNREMAIRMALGADFADIAALIYRAVLAPSALGLAAGLLAAAGLTRLLKSMLFGVTSGDARTLATAGCLLLVIALAAATAPALRAGRTDPANALRRD